MATISEELAIAFEHHQAGRLQAAERLYRRVLALDPNQADALHLFGVLAYQAGKHDIAVACIGRALGLKGHAADVHNNLGLALSAQGKFEEAAACYRRAQELKPDYADAHANLGDTHRDLGRLEEAVACYRQALHVCPECVRAAHNLATALREQGNLDEAVAWFRRALELKPDAVATHANLGGVLEEKGDLGGAEDCFRAALRHDARFAMAHYKLAELLGGKLPEADLAAQLHLLRDTELTDAQRLPLHFGLAHVLDARGEYAAAAEHLQRGNALQRSAWRQRGQEYDPQKHALFVSQMIAACTPEFFARIRGFGLESRLPVFVVGLPRSGTTLVEQVLASHSRVHGAGELRLGRQSFEAIPDVLGRSRPPLDCFQHLDAAALGWLAKRHEERLQGTAGRGAERIVDKMPDNYMYLGLLAALFPRALFIHCRRDPRDVAVSCWMTHFHELPWANDQEHIVSRLHEYERIMEHWRRVLPVPLREVAYEETVADPEGVARKLVAWCSLAWEPACLDFHEAKRLVRTSSVVQVRQPVFKTSVGRWKHYEQALAALFAGLENRPAGP